MNTNKTIINSIAFLGGLASFFLLAANIRATQHFVCLNNLAALPPYISWATAATNIQDAINASAAGDQVIVTDGVYQVGATEVYGMSNRVAVTQPLVVSSVNGPAATLIQGYQEPGTTNGTDAIRCVYMTNGAVLMGFTLTNGATQTNGDIAYQQSGGGVWCESPNSLLTNCIVIGNSAFISGGGAYSGAFNNCGFVGNSAVIFYGGGIESEITGTTNISILNNCILKNNVVGNSGEGGGGDNCTFSNCILLNNIAQGAGGAGGGASYATLINCSLTNNSADYGGGAWDCTLSNCTLTQNLATNGGGGCYQCTINNCVLVGNSASAGAGGAANNSAANNCVFISNEAHYGGGVAGATGGIAENCTFIGNIAFISGGAVFDETILNSIVYYNYAPDGGYDSSSELSYCCLPTLPPIGIVNFTSPPLFVNPDHENLRLQSNSPCINAGLNAYAPGSTDLDGNPRLSGGTVDVGAYEFQNPSSVISFAWLQQYGLPTDGSADFADPDHDGVSNYQEWLAGTDPTNAASVFQMQTPIPGATGLLLSWNSVTNRIYSLLRSTNIAQPAVMSCIVTNITGQKALTFKLDTNTVPSGKYFYRVQVTGPPPPPVIPTPVGCSSGGC